MTSFQLNQRTADFLSKYKLYEDDITQQIQLQHRLDIVKAFGIKKDMRVLEVGSGQGDTTVAIADAVGENGHVVAIDIASPEYGAPFTLGQATERIKKTILRDRIDFHFETDVDTFESNEQFDVVVLSHCSWYFQYPDDLRRYFKKLRSMCKRICFAEWDIDFTSINQRPHFCAASILALYSNYVNNDGNIKNVFHKTHIQQMLEDAEFVIEKLSTVEATFLQDGQWEKNYANSVRTDFVDVPPMIQTLIDSYYGLMNAVMDEEEKSLNSFIVLAK